MLRSALAAWLLVALCAAAGAYCVLRTRSTRDEEQRRSAAADAAMGFGMAVMAAPAAAGWPPPGSWQVCTALFGALALHAAWSARHSRHHVHHLVGASAMVYMAAVMAGGGHGRMDHMQHGGAGIPVLSGCLLVYFTAHVLWAGARLVPSVAAAPGVPDGSGPGWADRPELARACQVAMSIGMLAMLLAM